jgi:hypothetical protein
MKEHVILKLKKDAKWYPSVYTTVVPAQLWLSLRGLAYGNHRPRRANPNSENRLIMRVTGSNASLRHKGSFQSL